jgi:hypothetical protein
MGLVAGDLVRPDWERGGRDRWWIEEGSSV